MLKTHWLTGGLIFFMPMLLIFFLAAQMAAGQAKGRFETYQQIPQVSSLAELEALPAGQVVLLRGQIAAAIPLSSERLLIYQERPADGRENRYQEEFPLIFPKFVLNVADGAVAVSPSDSQEHVIQHELHTVPAGDRQYTGFQAGDTVTVQGTWQAPALVDATGLTSIDKASLLAEWQRNVQWVGWARNILGVLTLSGLILLVRQLRRTNQHKKENIDTWTTPQTKTIITT